jgi:tetratricopeptide (TPR) repeat protein
MNASTTTLTHADWATFLLMKTLFQNPTMNAAHPFAAPLNARTASAFVAFPIRRTKALITTLALIGLLLLAAPGQADDAQSEPKDAKGFVERGNSFSAKKDYDKAIADFTEAIRLDPKFADAYARRAYAYQVKGQNDEAITDSTKALELDPKSFLAFYGRGIARMHRKDFGKAVEDFTEAIRLEPNSSRSSYWRGSAYAAKGNYEQAIGDYTTTIRLDPKWAAAYRKRSAAYDKQGKKALAKADRQEVQRLATDSQEDPTKPADPTTPVMDLAKALEAAGFRGTPYEIAIEQYARFGSAKSARKATLGHPLDRVDAEDKAEGHRRKVADRVWCLRNQPIIVPKDNNEKYVRDGMLLVSCYVPFRVNIEPKEGKDSISDSLWRLHASWTSNANMWFLTKEGTLRECKDGQDVLAVEKANGILYIPEGKTTDLAFILTVEKAVAKKFVHQPREFNVDLVFDQLEYQQALDWGFYRRDKLIEADWNSQALIDWNSSGAFKDVKDPDYFRPEGGKMPYLVCADLVSAVLKDKNGKVIVSYKRETRDGDSVNTQQPDDNLQRGAKAHPEKK